MVRLRLLLADTPEERIAMVVRDFVDEWIHKYNRKPDIADIRERIRPWVEREIFYALAREFNQEMSEADRKKRALEIVDKYHEINKELGWTET